MLQRIACLFLLIPCLAWAAGAPLASVEGISEVRLRNGLQILLVPDDSKPTTTVNLTVRVGSRHENYGETGMAHLLEHMMFKGTPRHPQAWAEFEKRGLRANGTTSWDRTNYFASFSANEANLNWYVGWLADALVHSTIARKDLDTEMTVVRNEMEAGENDPGRILEQRVLSSMFEWHNYGKLPIGARSDVEGVDIARLRAFYRQYYQPDNATLVIAGRFDVDRTLSVVGREFGRIARPTRTLPRLYTLDPVQDGERSVTLRRTGGTPQLLVGYHTVPGAHPDQAALELIALIMGDTPSGRLHKRLTETRLASNTWAWAPALHDPGFALFGAALGPGQDEKAATAALLATLESVRSEPITAEELERARLKWLKGWDLSFTDPEQVGVALSDMVALGDWRLFFLLRDRVRTVTLADVQRVAVERLVASNRTLGTYLPTDSPQRAPQPAAVDLAAQMKAFVGQGAAGVVPPFDASPANIDARTVRGRLAGNAAGVQYALLPKPTRGQVAVATLVLRGGQLDTFRNQAEVATMLAAMLDKGTPQLSRQQVQDRLDALRTELRIGFGANEAGALTVNLVSRREHLGAALELVGQLLRNPSFDPAVLDELKRQALTDIEAQRKEPDAIVQDALSRHGNPYPRGDIRHARSFDERAQDVQAVTPEAVRALHGRIIGGSRVELAVVGDFEVEAIKAASQHVFGGWATAVPYVRVPLPSVAVAPTRMVFNTPDKQNAVMMVAQPVALREGDPDHPALTMANYLLGTGGNSRLWKRIREKEGLSYDVYSYMGWDQYGNNSWWNAGAIFAPANRAKVEAAFRAEVERALKDGFGASELAQGRQSLLNFRRLSRAQDGNVAQIWARNLDLNRSFDYSAQLDAKLEALTVEQVNAALRKYIDPARFVIGVAGDFKD